MTQTEYEFTTEQNAVIDDVATKVRHVAFLLFFITVILLIQFIVHATGGAATHVMASSLTAPLTAAGLGYLLLRGTNHLQTIVATAGNDIAMLFKAFGMFRNFYVVLWIVVAIGTLSRVVDAVVSGG